MLAMAIVLALGIEAPVALWTVPAQAEWAPGDEHHLNVRLERPETAISMRGEVQLRAVLAVQGPAFRISHFLRPTGGIAFDVMDMQGRRVAPLEPPATSPPAPPQSSDGLTVVRPGQPMTLQVAEFPRWVFPGPGRYRVRLLVSLMNIAATPARYQQWFSNTVTADVID